MMKQKGKNIIMTENSTCAALRGHLGDSWALVVGLYFIIFVCSFLKICLLTAKQTTHNHTWQWRQVQ